MEATIHKRTTCRLCGGTDLELVLPLTPTPPANAFVTTDERHKKQQAFPLDVYFCRTCSHVQLLDIVDPRLLFENYVYVSGTSPVFVQHFHDYAETVNDRFGLPMGALAVDIGSNDGTMLRFFKERGLEVLGIDPATAIARQASEEGIETIAAFFGMPLAKEILRDRGPAMVIVANNVFAHADNLGEIADAIRTLLSPEGVYVFEVSYLRDVIEKTLFDTIYHEHLAYHSVAPLKRFFQAHGLDLFSAERVETHGGSLRGYVQHAGGPHTDDGTADRLIEAEHALGLDQARTFQSFARDIERKGEELKALLEGLRQRGRHIAGYGAPAKATTLCYHFGLGSETLDYIVDDSPLKQGLYSPGTHIPVLPSTALAERHPDYLIVLAWNFADAIAARTVDFTAAGGRLIVPLPNLELR